MGELKSLIRTSVVEDLPAITAIYAKEVLHGLASFEVEPPDLNEVGRRREELLSNGYPYLVATVEDKVVGYAYAGPYRSRPAYRYSLENSIYVAREARNCGVGKKLLTDLIAVCTQGDWRTMIAVIGDINNTGSIALHRSLGFRHVGTIESIGYKLNQWVDSVIMQKVLKPVTALPRQK